MFFCRMHFLHKSLTNCLGHMNQQRQSYIKHAAYWTKIISPQRNPLTELTHGGYPGKWRERRTQNKKEIKFHQSLTSLSHVAQKQSTNGSQCITLLLLFLKTWHFILQSFIQLGHPHFFMTQLRESYCQRMLNSTNIFL